MKRRDGKQRKTGEEQRMNRRASESGSVYGMGKDDEREKATMDDGTRREEETGSNCERITFGKMP
jgi:hypothetical protein